ncbi:GTP cyclohydrolase I [Arthrobacter monumenti]
MLLDADSQEMLLDSMQAPSGTATGPDLVQPTRPELAEHTGSDLAEPTGPELETTVDLAAAEQAMRQFLKALGRDPSDPHLADTPRRVAHAFDELLTPRTSTWTTFPNSEGYSELVLVKDIPFHSLCAHHLLPFRGTAHIGYLPGDRLLGLSKLARGLELFARDLQIQERLTKQVADWLQATLQPRGVGVVLEAEHLCMSLRGVAVSGSRTQTSTFYGDLAVAGPMRDQFSAPMNL